MISFLFIIAVTAAAAAAAINPSLQRCQNALQNGYTEEPPFNGHSIVLTFVEDYPLAELKATVEALGPAVVESASYALEEREREDAAARERTRKHKEEIEERRLKLPRWREECSAERKRVSEHNAKLWFWHTPEREPSSSCPCIRWEDVSPCQELDCFDSFAGEPVQQCFWHDQGPPGYAPPRVNRLVLRMQ